MKDLFIIGAGGFGREVWNWARSDVDCGKLWSIAGFLDDNAHALDGYPCDDSIVGTISNPCIMPHALFVCAIGNPRLRLKICRNLESHGASFVSIIHPSAVVGFGCRIGAGAILCPGTVVTTNSTLGKYVIMNVHSSIGHDCTLGDGCTLSSHVDVTGGSRVGEGVFFGTHACLLPKSKVGDWSVIGAGSVVLRSVQTLSSVMGVPARQISKRT